MKLYIFVLFGVVLMSGKIFLHQYVSIVFINKEIARRLCIKSSKDTL